MSRKRDRETYRSFAAVGQATEAMRRMGEPPRARKPNRRRRISVMKGLLCGIATGLIVVIGLHMTLPANSGAVIKPTVVRTVPIAPSRY
jgi:hypothetical protein